MAAPFFVLIPSNKHLPQKRKIRERRRYFFLGGASCCCSPLYPTAVFNLNQLSFILFVVFLYVLFVAQKAPKTPGTEFARMCARKCAVKHVKNNHCKRLFVAESETGTVSNKHLPQKRKIKKQDCRVAVLLFILG